MTTSRFVSRFVVGKFYPYMVKNVQGIEFWSSVCDEEMDLAIEAAEAQEMGRPVEQHSANYARGALPYITPKLTQLLTQQDDDGDSEEWSPSKAAGVCLMNMGRQLF